MPGMFSHAHSQPAVLLADSEHLCSPLRLHHLLLHAGTMAQLDESVWRPYQDYASLGASYHAQALCHRRVCGGLPTTCSHEYLRTCPTKRNTDVALSLSRPRWVPCPCVCAWCLGGTGCGVMCWLDDCTAAWSGDSRLWIVWLCWPVLVGWRLLCMPLVVSCLLRYNRILLSYALLTSASPCNNIWHLHVHSCRQQCSP